MITFDNVVTTYKLFKYKEGKVYPLYVLANEVLEIGKYLEAKEGIKTTEGKVKSKLGKLAYRAGFHSSNKPFFKHNNSDGSQVWIISDNITINRIVEKGK